MRQQGYNIPQNTCVMGYFLRKKSDGTKMPTNCRHFFMENYCISFIKNI
jgi:hypothetical protein